MVEKTASQMVESMEELFKGKPLSYEEAKEVIPYVREHGILQLINIYTAHKNKTLPMESLRWGEVIENNLITFQTPNNQPRIITGTDKLIQEMSTKDIPDTQHKPNIEFSQEIPGWIIEFLPKTPYKWGDISHIINLQTEIKKRREYIKAHLKEKNMSLLQIATYPNLGCKNHLWGVDNTEYPMDSTTNPISGSSYLLDQSISKAPKYRSLIKNIGSRRGMKILHKVPIYMDLETPNTGEVILDTCLWGMAGCALQFTFEGASLNHTCYLHDQLHIFSPIIMALGAATPILMGKLLNIDLREFVSIATMDDRTVEEREIGNCKYLPRLRYDLTTQYISHHQYVTEVHMDGPKLPLDSNIIERFKDMGCTTRLSEYFALLFTRDPMNVFDDLEVDDAKSMKHFWLFQQGNWPDVRFKTPLGINIDMGWRVELRTMELQLTNIENAAFGVFYALLVNIITHFDVNFMLPISTVAQNTRRAEGIDAVLESKFTFRKNILGDVDNYHTNLLTSSNFQVNNEIEGSQMGELAEMSISQILEGDETLNYKGIIPLMQEFMTLKGYSMSQIEEINKYLDILRGRASGKFFTAAGYVRDYVMRHEDYKRDSLVTEGIAKDLISTLIQIDEKDEPIVRKL